MRNDLLVEILCEELPPKSLLALSKAFKEGVVKGLDEARLSYDGVTEYPSPRRLALIVHQLVSEQADQTVTKQGPALAHAYDKDGNPTKACEGFARGLGISVDELNTVKTDKGERVAFTVNETGQKTVDLIPSIINQSLTKLPVPKPMRWGSGQVLFVRPVHGVVLLYGDEVVKTTVLGLETTNQTVGHRFHHPDRLTLQTASDYESVLEKAYVVANFEKRRELIRQAALNIAKEKDASVVMDEGLLEEITNIVEWPVPLLGEFDKRFLSVPQEVLISSMAQHQKYIALKSKQDELLPYFITLSNIDSQDKQRVVEGNQKVIDARLSDAAFFYEKDKETTLLSKTAKLNTVVFQKQLGTLADKVTRVGQLTKVINEQMHAGEETLARAVTLSKADLMTEMVGEFPTLQGVMGRYYALHDKEDTEVASALYEQYLPRFSGDDLPITPTGTILALADRIDTLVGIFGINQKPTGVKDPFKCRRLALGVVRILLTQETALDIRDLLSKSLEQFEVALPNKQVVDEVHHFLLERLKVYYTSQGVRYDVVNAVISVASTQFNSIDKRIHALGHFVNSDQAASLAHAFKRVRKLFEKENIQETESQIDNALFESETEANLYQAMQDKALKVEPLLAEGQFKEVLEQLAALKDPVDAFFDGVMVLAEDKNIRRNRLALLSKLEHVFLQVADLSELQ